MTTLLKSMIAHYKETGSRVDEVLFQEVMKAVERVQYLEGAVYFYCGHGRTTEEALKRMKELRGY